MNMAKATTKKKDKKKAAKPSAPKVTAPKAAAKTTALTKTEQRDLVKKTEIRWEEVTTSLRGRRRQAAADIIQYRFDVGAFAIELMDDRVKELGKKLYGDRTVEQLCEALNESSSTVHTCIKFARKCDAKELDYFKKHEWPWRAISSIVTVDDAKEYKRLKDDFESKRFENSDQLKDAVKEVNDKARDDGTKDGRKGSPTAKSMIRSFNMSCNMLATKLLPNFLTAVKTFKKDVSKMDADSAEAVAKDLKESVKAVSTLTKMAERATSILDEIDL